MAAAPHPPVARVDLAQLLRRAADGRFPQTDGGFSRAAPWRPGVEAAVAFTGHAVMVVAEDVDDGRLVGLGVHGYGGAHDPRTTLALVGAGKVGVLDVLLLGRGTGGGGRLVARPDLASTERARHAAQWRDDVRVHGLPDRSSTSLATLSRGVGGLPEVGLHDADDAADELLHGVLALVPPGDVVVASVTPGNARSLRFFLRHGFVPVGSVQQWKPHRPARSTPVDHHGRSPDPSPAAPDQASTPAARAGPA
ncbi:N-acetyltransferase [Ornithinimicrobium avium]|uniref:N-acetyltransferase n=1 Tax=Ornithinimicrobium avium TaxID=2283195 RepID=A0A345NIL4_9MICO|nr:N-acetyltransferase [Ornithinimicrobium avium]AXH94872.1 N-acetyltransferase [Ornithinimicrobium avium]